jgi:hypothetical protein
MKKALPTGHLDCNCAECQEAEAQQERDQREAESCDDDGELLDDWRPEGEEPSAVEIEGRDYLRLEPWGCVVWLEGEHPGTLFGWELGEFDCAMAAGEFDPTDMAYEISAPDSQEFLDAVNAHFGTAYQFDEFAGR